METDIKQTIISNGKISVKVEHGLLWLLIFHHNAKESGLFSSLNQAEYYIDPNKFSILSKLQFIQKIDSVYEFLLEYPSTRPGDYNHWKQKNNPMDEYRNIDLTNENATGYEPIHIDFDRYNFSGLKRRTFSSLLSGGARSLNWYYPIGSVNNHYGDNAFPGDLTLYEYHVDLWVRILPSQTFVFPCFTTKQKMKLIPSSLLFIFLLENGYS